MEPHGGTLHLIGPTDADTVAAMWARLYRAAEPLESGSEGALDAAGLREATLRWTHQVAEGDSAFGLLARSIGGEAAGFIACGVWDRGWSRRGLIGNINALWVEPGCRRQGTGRRLAAAALGEMRSRGAQVFEVQALATNPSAQAFWIALGFEQKAIVLRA